MSGRTWPVSWALPDRGILVPALSRLAYEMHARFAEGRAARDRVSYDAALELIGEPDAHDVLRAGEALAVLDEHRGRDEILFFHQLLQEYFAARHLASDERASAEHCRRETRAGQVMPSITEVVSHLEGAEPLPPPPSTGWEEVVLLAATMSPRPERYLETLVDADLPLAARAASQPEVLDRMPESFLDTVRTRLIGMAGDPAVDLRVRIEAGTALGSIGDPRFPLREGPYGTFVRPPLVRVAGGRYLMGDDTSAAASSSPEHTVRIEAFEIGRFPVTNREWSEFVASGG